MPECDVCGGALFDLNSVEVHGGFAGVLDAIVRAVSGCPVGAFGECSLADYFS